MIEKIIKAGDNIETICGAVEVCHVYTESAMCREYEVNEAGEMIEISSAPVLLTATDLASRIKEFTGNNVKVILEPTNR